MSEKKLKNLPLGEQNFKKIIEKNLLYVDKTDEIYKLLSTGGTYFFLSRPRRFGKSLLISTLESIFLGEKELFKDLYIY
ncbi:MAG: AAA family ATPase, partial [Candidatus Sericytochromatia bacterium]